MHLVNAFSSEMNLLLFAILSWFGFLIIAVLNGAIREILYLETLGELKAHQLSTLTGMALILLAMYFFFSWLDRPLSTGQLVSLGVGWTIATVVFEFTFGYMRELPWEHLLADYNLSKGRLWSLFLLSMLTGPYLIHKVLLAD
jgi:hypothetical protein